MSWFVVAAVWLFLGGAAAGLVWWEARHEAALQAHGDRLRDLDAAAEWHLVACMLTEDMAAARLRSVGIAEDLLTWETEIAEADW